MKNKTLKHYKRKKFFYRFFMRKSPRSGAMFGLAWMNMVIALIPFFVFCIFQIVGRCDSWGGFVCFAENFFKTEYTAKDAIQIKEKLGNNNSA